MAKQKEAYWLVTRQGTSSSCEFMTSEQAEKRNEWLERFASPTIKWVKATEPEKTAEQGI